MDDENRIRLDSRSTIHPGQLDYKLPPLKRMVIRLEGDAVNPNHGYRAPLIVETEDGEHELNDDDPREMLETLARSARSPRSRFDRE